MEYAPCPVDRLVPVPDHLPAHFAVLAQPVGTVVHAVQKMGSVIGKTVVVLGQGPIGLSFTDFLVKDHLASNRVSIRYGQASPLTGVRAQLEAQPQRLRRGSSTVLSAVIGQVIDDYGPALDGLESDVLEAENDVFDGGSQPPIRRLYLLKRQILQLLVVGDAVQDPLARVMRNLDEAERGELQLALDQLARVGNRTRTLSDLVTTAINANLTLVSIQQNEDMRRISAWVAMAAVPTLLAGLYGMNFDQMPELHWRFGYVFALVLMASAVLALYRLFRRSGWL